MPTLGEIVTRYTVDSSSFSSAIAKMEQQAAAFDRSMGQHVSNVQQHMSRIPPSMARASSSIQTTTGHVNTFGRTVSRTASESSGHVERISSRVTSGFGGIGRSIFGTIGMLGGWGLAAGAAVTGAVGLGSALLKSSADMEQTKVAFIGLTGSAQAADAEMKALQDFAAKTPFEFPELAQDAMLLQGVGVAAKDVIPTMTAIGDAGAKMGLTGEGINRVTIAITQMIAKGQIAGDEMEQLTEARIPAWNILSKQMGIPVAQLREMGAQGKLGKKEIDQLIAGMEKFGSGAMKAQSQTMIGLLSTLKDEAGNALRAFTGPLFEAAKTGLAKLTEFLGSPAFQNFATGAAKWITDAFQKISQFIGPVVDAVGRFIGSLTQGNGPASQFGNIIQQIGGIYFGNFLDTIEQVSGFVTQNLIPAIQALSPTFQRIGDLFTSTIIPAFLQIWPVVNQVASVIRTVFLAAISAILPVIVNLANFLSSLIVPAFKFLAPYIVMAAKEVGKFASEVGGQLVPLLQQLGGTLNGIVNFIKGVFIAVWPTLGPIVGAAFQAVVSVIKTVWAIISGIIKIFLNVLRGDWSGAWNSLKDMVGGVWEGIKGIIGNALQVVLRILGAIFGPIITTFQNIWNKATEIWNNVWKTIGDFMGKIWHSIIDPWQPIITFITDVGRIIWGIISMGWNVIWGTISGALKRIWDVIVSVWNTISGFIGNIISTIWNTEVRGWTIIWNTISGFLGRIWGVISSVWNTIRNYISSVLTIISGIVSTIWNTIWGTITRFVGNIWNTITGTFNRIRDTVGGIFRGMINNIIDWLNPGLNAISNFINFFVNAINGVSQFFIHKNLLGTVHLGPIPHLAQGTDEFAGGLAVVGERGRELVVLPQGTKVYTNKETEQVMGQRGGSPVPIPHLAGGTGGSIGDILGNIFSVLTGSASSIASTIVDKIFSGAPSLGIFAQIAGALLSRVAGWLGDWIKSNIGSLFGPTGPHGAIPMQQQGQFVVPPWLTYPGHHGVDFQFPQNSPIPEVMGGMVLPHTGWYPWGGEIDVLIPQIQGMWERYLHMERIFVQAGQMLSHGQIIGLSGGGTPETGLGTWSNGPHLHYQLDWGDYGNWVWPFTVWGATGMFKPFGKGGAINEKIMGTGMRSGQPYVLGEGGSEMITPVSQQSRIIELLERIERVLVGTGPISDWQVQEALGKLLARGVRL